MALVIPGHKYTFGLAKQTAEGSAATTAEYKIPVYSSTLVPVQTRTPLEIADGTAFSPGEYISEAHIEGPTEWGAFPASLPRLVAAHLGAVSDTVTGAGDPYTHTLIRMDAPQFH